MPGRDSQDLRPAGQERNKTHEARYAQLRRLVVPLHHPVFCVQEVVQACVCGVAIIQIDEPTVEGGTPLDTLQSINTVICMPLEIDGRQVMR